LLTTSSALANPLTGSLIAGLIMATLAALPGLLKPCALKPEEPELDL